MTRKIIQICESAMVCESYGDMWNLSALCDDGTVWLINGVRDSKGNPCEWHRLPDIPQDEIPASSEYENFLREEERREQWREEMRQDAFGGKHG